MFRENSFKFDEVINYLYKEWLKVTIQEDIPYALDPAEGVVTEDLNNFSGLELSWQEWDMYYKHNSEYIDLLESQLQGEN